MHLRARGVVVARRLRVPFFYRGFGVRELFVSKGLKRLICTSLRVQIAAGPFHILPATHSTLGDFSFPASRVSRRSTRDQIWALVVHAVSPLDSVP